MFRKHNNWGIVRSTHREYFEILQRDCYHLRNYLVHKYKRQQSRRCVKRKQNTPFSSWKLFQASFLTFQPYAYSSRITFKCIDVFVSLGWMWMIPALICVTCGEHNDEIGSLTKKGSRALCENAGWLRVFLWMMSPIRTLVLERKAELLQANDTATNEWKCYSSGCSRLEISFVVVIYL